MSNLNWILNESFWVMRFYDLPNLFICLLLVLLGCRTARVPRFAELVLFGHCFLPLFLNGALFPFSYMPDALKYWRELNAIRSGELGILEALGSGNVEQAAALFSVMPFPFAITPLSIGFYNTFLYSFLFLWLYRKGVFTHFSMWFYLLYPTFALYTGMGLRDTLILLFMVVAVQWCREGRWLVMWLPLGLLLMIKFQNFFILAPLLLVFTCFRIRHTGISAGKGLIALASGLFAFASAAPFALPLVNKFRAAMFIEDGGERGQVELLEGPADFISEGATSGFYFLLKPFPWEATSPLQLIQSLESLGVAILLLLVTRLAWRREPRKLIFWVMFLMFALSIYGLVVFNYGTAGRYRYPFIVVFVLFVCADCHVRRLFKPLFTARWRRQCGYYRGVSEGGGSLK